MAIGSLGPAGHRKHCIRSRRLSSRKHQLRRREVGDSHTNNSNNSKCCAPSVCFWPSSRTTEPKFSSLNRQKDSTICTSQDFSLYRFPLCSVPATVPSSGSHAPLPLPPVVSREDRVGSPLSPFVPPSHGSVSSEEFDDVTHQRVTTMARFGSYVFGGVARSNGSRGSGGSYMAPSGYHYHGTSFGDGASLETEGAEVSGDEGDELVMDSKLRIPTSYTFRRRNAIVEGSEDAPRARDFSVMTTTDDH
ncbi:hypothetical protein BGW38_004404 [Lunasporangiospora selenospora]|uniref:Uncharacterized protein n=1 Tax=Lunasporangiospora selenospora TaxID=979761 RepID=A0A9P6KC20_9FUNG|nr:hypothetical protein BGW38_004404 [Lunasporangiospora selenospora]